MCVYSLTNKGHNMLNRSQMLYKIWLSLKSNIDSKSERNAIYKSFKRKSHKSKIAKNLRTIWKKIDVLNQ